MNIIRIYHNKRYRSICLADVAHLLKAMLKEDTFISYGRVINKGNECMLLVKPEVPIDIISFRLKSYCPYVRYIVND